MRYCVRRLEILRLRWCLSICDCDNLHSNLMAVYHQIQIQGNSSRSGQGEPSSHKRSRRSRRSMSPQARRRSASPGPNKKNSGVRNSRTPAHQSGFQDSVHGHRAPAVCAVCLGCHGHSFIECTAERLWDNNFPAIATRSNKALLLRGSDKPLCVDWQRTRSCPSRQHDDRHVCSGCLATSHGAQACSRAQATPTSHPI